MRILPALFKARVPQNEKKVPFVELLPLQLRDHVSGRGVRGSEVACLQELSILFACLKTNEFNEAPCSKEILKLNGCYKDYLDGKFNRKQERLRGTVTTGTKNLHARELNTILKKFPDPK